VDQDESMHALVTSLGGGELKLPTVLFADGTHLLAPTVRDLADKVGMHTKATRPFYDLVVIGAGPAGLANALYGASEGLHTLLIEQNAPGGQAGTSSKIENYLGFPMGVSGQELASRAYAQAEKFGSDIAIARTATRLECDRKPYRINAGAAGSVLARSIVIATGARYHKPPLATLARFEGLGVYYSATALEARCCVDGQVVIVGGGNSAGQAAVFLSHTAAKVHVLVRGKGLSATMSRYLIRRIEETPNIELLTETELVELHGERELEGVTWVDKRSGRRSREPVGAVFMMTGASPNTEWLVGCVALDAKGFVRTGADLGPADLEAAGWPLARPPQLFETSIPAVFAVGDVRANSIKRVASAVGEGSMCIQLVHNTLVE
jgi:thioredoxin reductase (NADPH)